MHVAAMFLGDIDALGSVWGRIKWLLWQFVHVAVTVSPFLKSPSPWMLWL
jgi:hypothetical protein